MNAIENGFLSFCVDAIVLIKIAATCGQDFARLKNKH